MAMAASRGLWAAKSERLEQAGGGVDNPYAVPFFWFMRSEISRFNARFGSKLEGSQAFPRRHETSVPKYRHRRVWVGQADGRGRLVLHTYESFEL